MTKTNYNRAANLIRLSIRDMMDRDLVDVDDIVFVRENLVRVFVEFFSDDNPRFDADRFREACKEE